MKSGAWVVSLGSLLTAACQVPEGPDQIWNGDMITAQGGTGGSPDAGLPDAGGSDTLQASLPPPAIWQEHWFEHNQLLRLIDQDEHFALYFDPDMNATSKAWLAPYLSNLWSYTKKTYGLPGDQRLFAVFHGGRYNGGHPASIFDATHDNRNVIDYGGDLTLWTTPLYVDSPTYTAGNVLELASLGVDKVPSANLTRFTFAAIYAFDALRALGFNAAADKVFTRETAVVSDYPRAGTYWFRDWYYPLWRDRGGAAAFARYFALLSQHYPKVPRADGKGMTYSPDMNWGEYVHFMSAAAGVDLKPMATTAFGWTDEREQMLAHARQDFPALKY